MARKNTLTAEEKKTRKSEYMKRYYLTNRDGIASARSVKVDCPICFGCYTLGHKAHHERSQRHGHALTLRGKEQTHENESALKASSL